MELVEFPKGEGDAVKMVQALFDAAEVVKESPDGNGLFVVYINQGDTELLSYANVSDGEIIEACFRVGVMCMGADDAE